jgi:hypothetical protein
MFFAIKKFLFCWRISSKVKLVKFNTFFWLLNKVRRIQLTSACFPKWNNSKNAWLPVAAGLVFIARYFSLKLLWSRQVGASGAYLGEDRISWQGPGQGLPRLGWGTAEGNQLPAATQHSKYLLLLLSGDAAFNLWGSGSWQWGSLRPQVGV